MAMKKEFFILILFSFNSLADFPPPKPRTFNDLIQQAAMDTLGVGGAIYVHGTELDSKLPTSLALQADPSIRTSFNSILPHFLARACPGQGPTTKTPQPTPTTTASTTTNKIPGSTNAPFTPDETDRICFTRGEVQALAGSGISSFLLNILGFLISFFLGCKFKAVITPSKISLEVERDNTTPPSFFFRQLSYLLSLRSSTVVEDPIDLVDLNTHPPAPDPPDTDPQGQDQQAQAAPPNPFDLPNGWDAPPPPPPATANTNPTNPFFFHNHL